MQTREKNKKLAVAMIEARINNRGLARGAGLAPATVSRLLNQRCDAKPETARAIAKVLKRTPAELGLIGGVR